MLLITKNHRYYLLYLLVFTEIICYYSKSDTYIVGSVIYLLSGLLISFFSILFPSNVKRYTNPKWSVYLSIGVFLLFANWMFNVFKIHVKGSPLDRAKSDMHLFIKVMVERFLSGSEKIYAKIEEVWGTPLDAVYLPAMWLPYSIPTFFNYDLRWAAFIAVLLSILLWFVYLVRERINWKFSIPFFILLGVFINHLIGGACWYFTYSEEGIVVFYYSLLCIGLLLENWKLVGISIALCLLSRFPLILMSFGALVILVENRKQTQSIIMYCCISVILLLLVSGTFDEINDIISIPFKYQKMINQTIGLKELTSINQNLGISKFMIHFGDIAKIIATPLTIFATIILGITLRFLKPNLTLGFQLLCMLKLTLVLFYNFLLFSNSYLLYTSSFVSLFILIGYPFASVNNMETVES